VGEYEELQLRILQGKSDVNINFDDLRHFLPWLGFEERTRGSHHIFRRHGARRATQVGLTASRCRCIFSLGKVTAPVASEDNFCVTGESP
jgi:hypothetical protein